MSYRVSVDPEQNCVFTEFNEFVQGEGLKAIEDAVRHPLFKPGMNVLRDTRQIELPEGLNFNWFKKDFDGIYSKEHALMSGTKFAWVVGSKEDYLKAHSWALVTRTTRQQNRRAFRKIEEAFKWLDISTGHQIDFASKEIETAD